MMKISIKIVTPLFGAASADRTFQGRFLFSMTFLRPPYSSTPLTMVKYNFRLEQAGYLLKCI